MLLSGPEQCQEQHRGRRGTRIEPSPLINGPHVLEHPGCGPRQHSNAALRWKPTLTREGKPLNKLKSDRSLDEKRTAARQAAVEQARNLLAGAGTSGFNGQALRHRYPPVERR